MSDLKLVIKGKGEEFIKDPKGVLTKYGILKEGEDLTLATAGGAEPIQSDVAAHLHTLVGEGEANI